jgi:hypothetical protein
MLLCYRNGSWRHDGKEEERESKAKSDEPEMKNSHKRGVKSTRKRRINNRGSQTNQRLYAESAIKSKNQGDNNPRR